MYNSLEEIEQDKLAKIIGSLIQPEIVIAYYKDSNIHGNLFFSKQGAAKIFFDKLKNELAEAISNYSFNNLPAFIKKQRKRIKDQDHVLHNSILNLLPAIEVIEKEASDINSKEMELKKHLFSCFFMLRDNCTALLDLILIQVIKKTNSGDIDNNKINIAKKNDITKDIPLFNNSLEVDLYIDILKKSNPRILDDNGSFILGIKSKSKSPIAFWFQTLTEKGKVSNGLSRDDQAKKLNLLINNLEISSKSLFTPAFDRNKLSTLLNKI